MLLHVGTQQAADVLMSRLAKFKESGHYSTNSPGLLAFCNFTLRSIWPSRKQLEDSPLKENLLKSFRKAFYDPIEIPFEKV